MAEKANNTINSYKPQDDPGKRQADPGRSDTSKGEETKTEKTHASGKKKSFEEIIAARREQMKQITDKLEAGLREYMSNDVQFKKVLETMAKFHHYSANNVLLIAMQMPTATHVASYTNWQKKFNRQVMKGQKGISIISPAPYKKKTEQEVLDPRTGKPVLGRDGKPKTEEVEVTVPHYKVAKVFDLAQTTGEPLPELDVPELTGTAENYEIFMDAMRAVSPVPIRFDEIEGGAKGYYDSQNKEIVIQNGMSEVQTMKTTVHELAHARLHDRDIMRQKGLVKDQRTRETEAEAVAHVLLSHYQIDSSGYSIPYLASYAGSQDTTALRASLDTIRKTAAEIFDEVEAYVAERDVDRYTIYQIEKDTPADDYIFMGMDFVKEHGYTVSMEYYQDVYRGYLRPGDTLDSLYEKFNRDDRPAATQMHSLSMSDIIVLHKAGEDHAYYVDSIGFTEVPEFFLSPQEQEEVIASEDPDISAEDLNISLNIPAENIPVENMPAENTVTNEDVVNEDVVVNAREASAQEATRQETAVQGTTLQEEQSAAAKLNSDQRTEAQRSQKTMQDIRDSSSDPSASEPAIPVEAALTFYAAECIDFPVMGEYHGGLTFEEAVKACRDLPDGQQNGGKGIGFSLHDGSEFEGDFPLIVSGQVQEKVINSIGYFRDSPAVQNAITEAKSYFSDPVSSLAQGQEKPPAVREGAREGRKESVLATLRENREKVRAAEKDKPEKTNVTQRKKGELSL